MSHEWHKFSAPAKHWMNTGTKAYFFAAMFSQHIHCWLLQHPIQKKGGYRTGWELHVIWSMKKPSYFEPNGFNCSFITHLRCRWSLLMSQGRMREVFRKSSLCCCSRRSSTLTLGCSQRMRSPTLCGSENRCVPEEGVLWSMVVKRVCVIVCGLWLLRGCLWLLNSSPASSMD